MKNERSTIIIDTLLFIDTEQNSFEAKLTVSDFQWALLLWNLTCDWLSAHFFQWAFV